MKFLDYIYTNDEELFANQKSTFNYQGYLANTSNNIYMRYTINDNNQINEIPMFNNNGIWSAEVNIPEYASIIDFSFINEKEYLDNNYEENYNFNILPTDIRAFDSITNDVNFFENDYLLEHNLNEEISNQAKIEPTFTLLSSGEIVEEKNLNTEIILFEDELNKRISDIHDKLFEANKTEEKAFEPLSILDSAFIETNEIVKTELAPSTMYFYSKIPYAKHFKEQQAGVFKLEDIVNEEIEVKKTSLYNTNEYIFTSKVNYFEDLRKLAKQNELILKENESNFLVVSAYSDLELFDDTVIGTIKKIATIIKKAFGNLNELINKSFGFSETI